MKREQAINNLLDKIGDSLVISSNGKISRELFELRKKRGEPTNDFYMLGSMGCAVPIALGVALNIKQQVYVLTGDGALLMKFGALATRCKYGSDNLHIIVLNNNAHDSCGGQPTAFQEAKYYADVACDEIIDVSKGVRKNLGRITISPEEIAKNFSEKVRNKKKRCFS